MNNKRKNNKQSYFEGIFNINAATLSGCVDIIAIK